MRTVDRGCELPHVSPTGRDPHPQLAPTSIAPLQPSCCWPVSGNETALETPLTQQQPYWSTAGSEAGTRTQATEAAAAAAALAPNATLAAVEAAAAAATVTTHTITAAAARCDDAARQNATAAAAAVATAVAAPVANCEAARRQGLKVAGGAASADSSANSSASASAISRLGAHGLAHGLWEAGGWSSRGACVADCYSGGHSDGGSDDWNSKAGCGGSSGSSSSSRGCCSSTSSRRSGGCSSSSSSSGGGGSSSRTGDGAADGGGKVTRLCMHGTWASTDPANAKGRSRSRGRRCRTTHGPADGADGFAPSPSPSPPAAAAPAAAVAAGSAPASATANTPRSGAAQTAPATGLTASTTATATDSQPLPPPRHPQRLPHSDPRPPSSLPSRPHHHSHSRLRLHLHLALAAALVYGAAAVFSRRTPDHVAEILGNATLRALYPTHPWSIEVERSDTPRGPTRSEPPNVPFLAVQTDNDQLSLYDENLELDLAPWRRRRNASELTVAALLQWAARLPRLASQRVVMIKGGRLALLQQRNGSLLTCERPCDVVLDELLKELRTWLSESPSEWPDVVFFLNAADTSLCQQQRPDDPQIGTEATAAEARGSSGSGSGRRGGGGGSGGGERGGASGGGGGGGGRRRSKAAIGGCPVPVLSLIKEWDRHKDEDILVPPSLGMRGWGPLHYFPWKQKIDRAVFRGREYCHTRTYPYAQGTCSRTYMALMTQYNPEWSGLVDVGLVDNYTFALSLSPSRGDLANKTAKHIAARGFVRASELARFRYVLSLDGITASSRLARLLALNSVVLKQASPWIEWYYRSLVPGTHYVSIWTHHRSDVLHVLKSLRYKGRYLYDIATHGQAFAYRYLTPNARRLYWLRALREYRQLFSDMDSFLASQEIPESEPVITGSRKYGS
ncbi:hypothetical protein PLESTF_000619500 [Pleodorina starrii]|nr:hypothetical protein PLESTM_001000900 [Pleodorina starrii]GLC67889.1 hypothetical protein PLESTF_000619500 [Pleodorina starrii]